MGTTPNEALPYPEQGDPVDVAGDIKALAEKIDLLMATAGSAQRPMRIISGSYSNAWQVFRATPGKSTSSQGYAPFPDPLYKGNPARWQFRAPEDGLLMIQGSFTLGYLRGHSSPTMHMNFVMNFNVISGPASNIHDSSHYARVVRHHSGSGTRYSGQTEGQDDSYLLTRSAKVRAGTVVSPSFYWSGVTTLANAPRVIYQRINGVWIPGEVTQESALTGGAGSATQPYTGNVHNWVDDPAGNALSIDDPDD